MSRRVGLRLLVGAVLVAGCGQLGFGGEQVCTAMGCVNGVTVSVAGIGLGPEGGRVVAEFCFDGSCERTRYAQQPSGASRSSNPQLEVFVQRDRVDVMLLLPDGDYDEERAHDVTLTLRVAGGDPIRVERQVNLERSQPNGPDCAPLCWGARIEHAA